MNFSRGEYFKELCVRIANLSDLVLKTETDTIKKRINNEIECILQKQKGGFWDITRGDSVFIQYMRELYELLGQGLKKRELDSFLNDLLTCAIKETEKKVKIVFFTQESYIWTSFESIYRACANDDRFIAQLVYIPFNHPNAGGNNANDFYTIYKDEMNLPIVRHDEYSISAESPDVAFFIKPYDLIPMQYYIDDVDKVVRRCVFIRYGFEIAAWNVRYHFELPLHTKAWRFIVYGEMLKQLAAKHMSNDGKNVVAWGHPRADIYRNFEMNRDCIPQEWKNKIAGRKTVLWNTQHTIQANTGGGTFFQWKDELFDFFENNFEICLIWRPHPLMFGAIINDGYMTSEELDSFVNEQSERNNIIIDRSTSYKEAFFASDAIITDGTAFLIEYQYTGNPLLLTYKSLFDENTGEEIDGIYFREEFFESLYIAQEKNDVANFLNMILCNEDHKKKAREELTRNLLTINPEGNGEFIKNRLFSEILREEKERATLKDEVE